MQTWTPEPSPVSVGAMGAEGLRHALTEASCSRLLQEIAPRDCFWRLLKEIAQRDCSKRLLVECFNCFWVASGLLLDWCFRIASTAHDCLRLQFLPIPSECFDYFWSASDCFGWLPIASDCFSNGRAALSARTGAQVPVWRPRPHARLVKPKPSWHARRRSKSLRALISSARGTRDSGKPRSLAATPGRLHSPTCLSTAPGHDDAPCWACARRWAAGVSARTAASSFASCCSASTTARRSAARMANKTTRGRGSLAARRPVRARDLARRR